MLFKQFFLLLVSLVTVHAYWLADISRKDHDSLTSRTETDRY